MAEIIEVFRSLQGRSEELAAFLGAESIDYFGDEIERLKKVVLDLSGATAMRNFYHDQLVELGAADVGWRCLEEVDEKFDADELDPKEIAEWLLIYGDGKVFGTEVKPLPKRRPSNAEMVKQYGLLPPREDPA